MEGDREGERSGIGDEIPGLGYFLTDKFNGFLLHAGVKPSLHTEFSRQATKELPSQLPVCQAPLWPALVPLL